MPERGDERVGDAERQHVIDLLRAHTGAGRLTLDEFAERAGDVYAALTRRQLDAVLADLPEGVDVPPPGPPAAADAAAPVPRGRARRTFVAIMSGARARGRWRAPRRILAFAWWGGVDINLRDAQIESQVIDITAWAIMGGVTVRVPEGIPVDLRGLVIMGGAHDGTRATEPLPGAPLVRVHARGLWGGVTVKTARTRGERRAQMDRRAEARARYHAERAERYAARARRYRPPVPPLPSGPPAPPDPPAPPVPPSLPGVSWSDRVPDLPGMPGRAGPAPAAAPANPEPAPAAAAPVDPGPAPAAVPANPEPARAAAAPVDPEPAPTGAAVVDPGSAPEGGRWNGGGARPPSGTLTMMVTDIAGSTRLAEALGDRRWMGVLGDHNVLVRAEVERHGGTEVKAQGDGFLVVFASARRAILAAVGIQQALASYRAEHPDHPVSVRIGLHTGEIVDVDGDVFGQNVIVAVRIAGEAAPDEIMVSSLTRDLTLAGGDLSFDAGREVELKGLSQPWRVHRVSWAPTPA